MTVFSRSEEEFAEDNVFNAKLYFNMPDALEAAGGSVGSRVRRTGFLRFGRCKDRCSGAEATVVVDHAEPAHESQFRRFDLPRAGVAV